MALLEVRGLSVAFGRGAQALSPVHAVSFDVEAGEVVGLVGESGSGKTVTCRAVIGLLPGRARLTAGSVRLDGRELVGMHEAAIRRLRGAAMAMIFQNPSSHLDPVMTVGEQIAEAVVYHERVPRRAARARARELLAAVGIADAEHQCEAYPHQFSGGMRQRVMIAMALACRPRLLIADEPTTALDVTVQAQILRLLLRLRDDSGLAIVLVTHDLGVVAQTCDRVAVMYAGRLLERGPKRDLLRHPLHPYTEGLIRSQPEATPPGRPLVPIEGQPPPLTAIPPGCPFHPRCAYAVEACRAGPLPEAEPRPGHVTHCHRWRVLAGAVPA